MAESNSFDLAAKPKFCIRLAPFASHSAAFAAGSAILPALVFFEAGNVALGLPLASLILGLITFAVAKPVRGMFREIFPGQKLNFGCLLLGVLTFPYSALFTIYQIIPAMGIYFGVNSLSKLFDLRYYESNAVKEIEGSEKLKQGFNVALFGGASMVALKMMITGMGDPLVLKIIAVFFGLVGLYALCLSLARREPLNSDNFHFTESQAQCIRLIAVASAMITLISGVIFLGHLRIG